MTRTSKSGGCSFSFSERSPYISANTFWIILIFCTHYYTIIYRVFYTRITSPNTQKCEIYGILHIFTITFFYHGFFKVLNVFLGCSGGFSRSRNPLATTLKFSEAQKCEFPYVLLLNCYIIISIVPETPINEPKSRLGVFQGRGIDWWCPQTDATPRKQNKPCFPPNPPFFYHIPVVIYNIWKMYSRVWIV